MLQVNHKEMLPSKIIFHFCFPSNCKTRSPPTTKLWILKSFGSLSEIFQPIKWIFRGLHQHQTKKKQKKKQTKKHNHIFILKWLLLCITCLYAKNKNKTLCDTSKWNDIYTKTRSTAITIGGSSCTQSCKTVKCFDVMLKKSLFKNV